MGNLFTIAGHINCGILHVGRKKIQVLSYDKETQPNAHVIYFNTQIQHVFLLDYTISTKSG